MNDKNFWKQLRPILLTTAAVTSIGCMVILLFFRTGTIVGIFNRLISILKPFICGLVIAYLLHPVCLRIENLLTLIRNRLGRKKPAGWVKMASILLSLAFMFLLIFLLLLAVLPEIISSLTRIVRQMPAAVDQFSTWVSTLDHGTYTHEMVTQIQQAADTLTEHVQSLLQTSVVPNLQSLLSNVTSSFRDLLNVFTTFGLGCIISAYLLGSWDKFTAQLRLILYAVFPYKAAAWIGREARFTDKMFGSFIHGKLLDSLIIGLICFAFTMITKTPYAMLISVLVGVTNIIPFFGPYLGAIPSLLLLLTVSPVKCLIFLVFIVLLQQFDGNFLGPAILGDKMGISGFWIMFSILFFSSLWGIWGMLIGVPLFAVIYDLIRTSVYSLLKLRKQERLIQAYEKEYPHEPPKKAK